MVVYRLDAGVARLPSRAALLARAASQLFGRRGYTNVSLQQIAAAAGVTAPAVYRYFGDKQALLAAAVDWGLDAIEDVIGGRYECPLDPLVRLSHTALSHDGLWQLMRRETRNLSPAQQAAARERFRRILKRTYELVSLDQPGLSEAEVRWRGRSVFAVLAAPSQYPQTLPKSGQRVLLERLVIAVVTTSPATNSIDALLPTSPRPFLEGVSRQEQILMHAARLFGRRGYQDVSMNEIGDAVGMAGPSVYHHFASKGDILEAIFRRGLDWMEYDQMRAARECEDPLEMLERALGYYAVMGIQHHELFSIYISDGVHLDRVGSSSVVLAYGRMVDRWAALMNRARPALSAGQARLLVTAALCQVNELTEAPTLIDADDGLERLLSAMSCVIRS